jgi:diguanylate cyclase
MPPLDRTFTISQRVTELMRTHSESASPQSYDLWFNYLAGHRPSLNEEMREVLQRGGRISAEDCRILHDKHLSEGRLSAHAERTGADMLVEIEQVVDLIDTAIGSTARYDQSLQAISADLADPQERTSLRDILESLVLATRDVAETNRSLEGRLKESRSEIEGLRQTLETVRSETLIDPLTGIANRKHFEETLRAAVDAARISQQPLALVVIDIDNFKRFNDAYGHLTGDQVLRLVASAMQDSLGDRATLARFGGEEFAMIVPGADLAEAKICAEKVRRNVEARELLKRSTGESLGRVTVSLGVAMLHGGESATALLERADHCMYRAKREGRNRTIADQELAARGSISDAA